MKEHNTEKKKWTTPTLVIISSPEGTKTDVSRKESTLPVDGTFNGNNFHNFPGIGQRYIKSFTS